MTSAFCWQNAISLCPASFRIPRPHLPVTPGVSCLPMFAFQFPIMKRTSFLGFSSRRSCRSSQNRSASASSALLLGAQTYITVILNGLPWKQTEIILSFLRLHPSTAFLTFNIYHKFLMGVLFANLLTNVKHTPNFLFLQLNSLSVCRLVGYFNENSDSFIITLVSHLQLFIFVNLYFFFSLTLVLLIGIIIIQGNLN